MEDRVDTYRDGRHFVFTSFFFKSPIECNLNILFTYIFTHSLCKFIAQSVTKEGIDFMKMSDLRFQQIFMVHEPLPPEKTNSRHFVFRAVSTVLLMSINA